MNVLLKIVGTGEGVVDDTAQSAPDAVETITDATLYRKDGAVYLFYSGSDMDSSLTTKQRITIRDNYLELQRSGGMQMTMTIEPGELHDCQYVTAYGALSMQIGCSSLSVSDETERFYAMADYSIYVDGLKLSDNHLTIEVRPYREDGTIDVGVDF